MTVSTHVPQDNPRAMDGAHPQPETAPRGEYNHDRERIADMDRRLGVPVPIGTRVMFGDDQRGIIIGGTYELAIIRDERGYEQAETWGTLMVQAGGPAFPVQATAGGAVPATAPRRADLLAITADEYKAIADDPYRAAALRALDLMTYVDRIEETFETLDRDRQGVAELLSQVEMALGTIADNRTRRILDARESEVVA